jgi:hypothetical protein
MAREVRAKRAKNHLKDVPLYTNDNMPTGEGEISVIGPPSSLEAGSQPNVLSPKVSLANQQRMAYLRGKLSQIEQHMQLHQRELSVLQQQISQSNMEWTPNPNETLRQEYSRQNVNNLANEIKQKRQQIADEQHEAQGIQDELERDQARYGGLSQPTPAGASRESYPQLPPGVKPGTPEYWQARIQAAEQHLQTAKEEQSLARNELSLLKLQQLRTLDPNAQANLASSIPAKQAEVSAAAQAVEKAQQELERLQKEAQAGNSKPR